MPFGSVFGRHRTHDRVLQRLEQLDPRPEDDVHGNDQRASHGHDDRASKRQNQSAHEFRRARGREPRAKPTELVQPRSATVPKLRRLCTENS